MYQTKKSERKMMSQIFHKMLRLKKKKEKEKKRKREKKKKRKKKKKEEKKKISEFEKFEKRNYLSKKGTNPRGRFVSKGPYK